MRKSRPYKKKIKDDPLDKYRRNEGILSTNVFIIDETGEKLGVMATSQALAMAREREVDLVEVSPKADPPVAKFLDFGKFQYQQEKLAKKQKALQKKVDIKGVRLSLRIGEHDLQVRREQTKKFLADGDKVRLEMILRGRERQYINQAQTQFNEFITQLGENVKIESPFSKQGGRMTITIASATANNT